MNVLLVGGVFDALGGRPSGYFGKLAASIAGYLPNVEWEVFNGGHVDDLAYLVDSTSATHIVWMCDVPNEYGKVLSNIIKSNPGVVLIQSKNNIGKRYSKDQLVGRMHVSGAEMLVEFDRIGSSVYGRIHTCTGFVVCGWTDRVDLIASMLVGEINRIDAMSMPLEEMPYVPYHGDVGAFGVDRKYDVHTGVDLYCEEGTAVYAMEDSYMVSVPYFTGERAGSPWWEDTYAVMLAGKSGVLLYGEIEVVAGVSRSGVCAGQLLGYVKRVLKKDKGRPMSMLHMERYVQGTEVHVRSWELGVVQPKQLLDVTSLLRGKV